MKINTTTEGEKMSRVECIRNGALRSFTAMEEITLEQLEEWQEMNIGNDGFTSISIVIDGKIYSTLEA